MTKPADAPGAPVAIPWLDIQLTAASAEDVATWMLRRPSRVARSYTLGNLNLHGLYLFYTDRSFHQHVKQADALLADGWPIWAMMKVIGWRRKIAVDYSHRVGSTDWLDALIRKGTDARIKILAVGGTQDSSRDARDEIQKRNSAIEWTAVDGYEGAQRLTTGGFGNREFNVVMVGLGMPLQEHWILKNKDMFEHSIIANVGGCIDYYSGQQELAPRFLGRLGFEWLYRLAKDPRRLWRRYLVEPFQLAFVMIKNRGRSPFDATEKR
ncbi:WecB/TagA/CpsF family glycosyltransferase [Pseudoclavibacter helvolus]|uniref:WecB/TagA/CpsF family glycosyltransferase n=1 Tax=Pseudoclavibacter helvolus TaxID=255205 RepID=UPI000AE6C42A|nr:WecB/TagA/CpsF family glycosyltransferase [Pseudoclavibacter helvolus]